MAKITEKDRAQLLRMAGNIAGGIMAGRDLDSMPMSQFLRIANDSASMAYETMLAVDDLIEREGTKS